MGSFLVKIVIFITHLMLRQVNFTFIILCGFVFVFGQRFFFILLAGVLLVSSSAVKEVSSLYHQSVPTYFLKLLTQVISLMIF